MSSSADVTEDKELDFKWGKKRGVGGKKKEVQFYESFTYDGVEYRLYDSVYVYQDGEEVPHIGKIIKIWENPDKSKKVKLLWYFHPIEILHWIEGVETLENELFLASGEGVGLANVNPLEAIAGKSNVICISSDSRNPQPSDGVLQMADYVFYRTFDVGKCAVVDKIDEKICGLEVKFIFNREECKTPIKLPKLDSEKQEDEGNAVASNETLNHSKKIPHKTTVTTDGKSEDPVEETVPAVKASLAEPKALPGEKSASVAHENSLKLAADNVKEENGLASVKKEPESDKKSFRSASDYTASLRSENNANKNNGGTGKVLVNQAKVGAKVKSPKVCADDGPHKRLKTESLVPSSVEKNMNDMSSLNLDENDKIIKCISASEETTKSKLARNPLGMDKVSSQKLKPEEKMKKLSNGTVLKCSAGPSPECEHETNDQLLEVTQRPDADRSKWFTALDVIWHAFKESCTAKMIQSTAISSPHNGQALVIFKTSEAATMVLRQLDQGCLMLPDGRPLVGIIPSLANLREKRASFPGHLGIDKLKLQMQREMKHAVSTSHCSQPNTIEYEMALDWCLLQARSDRWWEKMYMHHGDVMGRIKAKLKSR
ncbi:hypothetical protein RJ641_006005 [Dillenia turbinata]|uniref:BAH domain-containing protein n=1 Tax=Dillenia turbinata TaxID=194707 RepID=A0AAN8V642_9MAGN